VKDMKNNKIKNLKTWIIKDNVTSEVERIFKKIEN
jgi:hypothetical protein